MGWKYGKVNMAVLTNITFVQKSLICFVLDTRKVSQTKDFVKGIHLAKLHVAQCILDSHLYRWVIPFTLTSKRMPLNIVFSLQMFCHCLNKPKDCIFHIPCYWTSDIKQQTGETKITMECMIEFHFRFILCQSYLMHPPFVCCLPLLCHGIGQNIGTFELTMSFPKLVFLHFLLTVCKWQ